MTEINEDEQRGKRRTASLIELLLLSLIIMSIGDIGNAFKTLELILVYAVGLIVALRGLDAHYNPKRL